MYVLNANKRKNQQQRNVERLDNRDILFGQPTLITTGRGIKNSAIFVPSTQKEHEVRDERRGKKKCRGRRRQCPGTQNFNLHTADEKVTVHG